MTARPYAYARVQIIVHWLTLLVMLASFISHDAMETAWLVIRRGHDAQFTPDLAVRVHVIAGSVLLALTLLRIWLRVRHGAPAPVAGQHRLITIGAASVHGLLYLFLLALPVTGMVTWFGGVLVTGPVHGVLFAVTLGLLGAHVLAALVHQFFIRDNLLARMGLWR